MLSNHTFPCPTLCGADPLLSHVARFALWFGPWWRTLSHWQFAPYPTVFLLFLADCAKGLRAIVTTGDTNSTAFSNLGSLTFWVSPLKLSAHFAYFAICSSATSKPRSAVNSNGSMEISQPSRCNANPGSSSTPWRLARVRQHV